MSKSLPKLRSLRGRLLLYRGMCLALLLATLAVGWHYGARSADRTLAEGLEEVLLVIVLDGVITWRLTRGFFNRLHQTGAAASRISADDLTCRLPVSDAGDELDHFSSIVNGMIARLQISSVRQEELFSNLMHELRQPLTILRADSEHALRSGDLTEDCRALLASHVKQLEHLSNTVSDLVTLAKAESGSLPVRRNRENIAELVQAAVDGVEERAAECGITIACKLQPDVIAEVDTGQVWRLLLNLLDNAIKYNRPGGRVGVELTVDGRRAAITVSDTGRGIAPNDLPYIFQRSYRSADAKQSGRKGLGLGLSFVRWIAEAHGGSIEVSSRVGEGSCFCVWLPAVTTSPAGEHNTSSYEGLFEPAYASAGDERI